ncbi:MAG: hypothetical protein ABR502_05340 [Chitinophagaceae bacterium]
MKVKISLLLILLYSTSVNAQLGFTSISKQSKTLHEASNEKYSRLSRSKKLFQRNHGVIIGLQRGRSTAIELGGEAHWRKLALVNPHITGATGNMEYNFGDNVIGYKAGMWMKRGRINLTYGGNFTYFNDFKGLRRYGIGPSVGFRLIGFHLINGFNFLAGDKELNKINTLYINLRYYFPVQNKFTWDRKTLKKRENRQKERAKEKKRREKEKEDDEKKGIQKLLDFKD